MSNCWQGNGSFDFHIFMNGIYILLGYLLKYVLNVAGFASVQDSTQHALRSSMFWETDPLVIIPAVFSLTAQLEHSHLLPSHDQRTTTVCQMISDAQVWLFFFSFLYNQRLNNMPPSGEHSSTLEWDFAVQGHPEQHAPPQLWLPWHTPLRSLRMVTFCKLKRYQKISR